MSKEASTWRCSMLRVEAVTMTDQSLGKNPLEIGETPGQGGGDCWLNKGCEITFQTDFIVSTEREGFATDTEDVFIAEVDTIEQISVLNLLVRLGLDLIHQSHHLDLLHHSLDLLCVLVGGLQSRVRDPTAFIPPNLTIWIPPTWPWVKTKQ